MCALKVTLKQHTPLIHFQRNQEGATLRASEVKPKLDKFILGKISPAVRDAGESDGWIKANGQKVWLDYKMKIVAGAFQNISIPSSAVKKSGVAQRDSIGRPLLSTDNYPDNKSSLIMSNIGGRVESELFNFSIADKIYITILTHSEPLRQLLINNLQDFFSSTCFGNRTSKGFGSFDVEQIDGKSITAELCSDSYILSFTMIIGEDFQIRDKGRVYKDVFTIIHKFWKSLKTLSGVQGKASNNVLLNVRPQTIQAAERIPSPIRFKPLVDFYKEGDFFYCDVNISFFLDKEVIGCAADNQIDYFKNILSRFKTDKGMNIREFIEENVSFKIDGKSVSLK